MRNAFLFLFLLSVTSVSAQHYIRYNYVGSYITHPGFSLEYVRNLKVFENPENGNTSCLAAQLETGVYFHKNLYRDVFLGAALSWTKVKPKGFQWGFGLGAGLSRTLLYKVYEPNAKGDYELVHFRGDSHFYLNPSISFGRSLKKLPYFDSWQVTNTFWYYPSYNGQASINYLLKLGLTHKI